MDHGLACVPHNSTSLVFSDNLVPTDYQILERSEGIHTHILSRHLLFYVK